MLAIAVVYLLLAAGEQATKFDGKTHPYNYWCSSCLRDVTTEWPLYPRCPKCRHWMAKADMTNADVFSKKESP